MTQDNQQLVSKSALRFLSGTFLSRCSGLGRDLSMAFYFGSDPAVAAFMVAFRFANLFRRLFGEGALPASFVPHFETLRGESLETGNQFFRDLFFSLSVFLMILIAVSEGVLCVLYFNGIAEEIVFLTMLMLPGTLFICLYGLSSALLQCNRKFFLSAVAPVAFNVVWIVTVWSVKDKLPREAMGLLALSVTLAFASQWLVTMRDNWKVVFSRSKVSLFSPHIVQTVKSLLLTIVGVGAFQINGVLDSLFARYASLEGPAYLWYAIRLEQLPLALFGIALSSALLPPLARAIQSGDLAKHRELLHYGLQKSFKLMLPCTVGLFLLGASGVNLLYGRGDFTQEATLETIKCLWGYSFGLLPAAFVILLAPSYYAQKDYKTPARIAIYTVLVNMALNALFVFGFKWGAFSVAIATSLANFVNVWFLSRELQNVLSMRRIGFICLVAAGVTSVVAYWMGDPTWQIALGRPVLFARQLGEQVMQFGFLGGIYLAIVWLLFKVFIPKEG